MSVEARIQTLLRGLDPAVHAGEIAKLRACRGLADLEAIARGGGWLTPEGRGPRVKLVRHGSGTFLLVSYDDGWTKTLSQG